VHGCLYLSWRAGAPTRGERSDAKRREATRSDAKDCIISQICFTCLLTTQPINLNHHHYQAVCEPLDMRVFIYHGDTCSQPQPTLTPGGVRAAGGPKPLHTHTHTHTHTHARARARSPAHHPPHIKPHHHYQAVYEPLEDTEDQGRVSYIRMYNVVRMFVCVCHECMYNVVRFSFLHTDWRQMMVVYVCMCGAFVFPSPH
jgi:hypothetical protein